MSVGIFQVTRGSGHLQQGHFHQRWRELHVSSRHSNISVVLFPMALISVVASEIWTACNSRQRLKAAGYVEMYKQRAVLLHWECPRKTKLVFIHYSLDVRNCLLSAVRFPGWWRCKHQCTWKWLIAIPNSKKRVPEYHLLGVEKCSDCFAQNLIIRNSTLMT
jgi:hypothetical protein